MTVKVKSMTEGKPIQLIIGFALPLMLGNIFQQFYTVVDGIVVGNYFSVSGLAAIGAADWLYWGIFAMGQGLAQGFSILMAQNFGANKIKQLKENIADSTVLTIVLSFLIFIFGQVIAKPVFVLLKTPADILPISLSYIRCIFCGITVNMIYNLLAAILRSLGDSKTPLNAMIVASVTNIVLDLFFIVVCKMDIKGAAIATILGQIVSGLYCYYFIRKITFIKLSKDDFQASVSRYAHLVKLGLPMALQFGIIAVGGMIVQSAVNSYGTTFIAGFTATNKLYGLLEIAAVSFGFSMVTYVGQNLGANNLERIKQGYRSANIVAIVTSLIISITVIVFGREILSLFLSGEPQQVEIALEFGYQFLCVMAYGLVILYVLHVTRNAIQGLGNTFLPMVSAVVEFVMRISAVFFLPKYLSVTGIFLAEPLAWFGADIVLITSYFYLMHKLQKERIH